MLLIVLILVVARPSSTLEFRGKTVDIHRGRAIGPQVKYDPYRSIGVINENACATECGIHPCCLSAVFSRGICKLFDISPGYYLVNDPSSVYLKPKWDEGKCKCSSCNF